VPFEIRFSFFEEGVQAFQAILGLEAMNLKPNFLIELRFQIFSVIAYDGAFHVA
jgi:hypothetical protein